MRELNRMYPPALHHCHLAMHENSYAPRQSNLAFEVHANARRKSFWPALGVSNFYSPNPAQTRSTTYGDIVRGLILADAAAPSENLIQYLGWQMCIDPQELP